MGRLVCWMFLAWGCRCDDKKLAPTPPAAAKPVAPAPAPVAAPAKTDDANCPSDLTAEQKAELARQVAEKIAADKAAGEAEWAKKQDTWARYCATLAKKLGAHQFDPSRLEPKAKALEKSIAWLHPKMVMCTAAKKGARACQTLLEDARDDCLMTVEMSTALSKGKPDWRFGATFLRLCGKSTDAALCERARDAVIAGDATRCPDGPMVGNYCRALASLDASACSGLAAEAQEFCRNQVRLHSVLATGGLLALSQEGNEWEQVIAKAALGDSSDCVELGTSKFLEICKSSSNLAQP